MTLKDITFELTQTIRRTSARQTLLVHYIAKMLGNACFRPVLLDYIKENKW